MSRARELGMRLGGSPGRWNAISDMPGVEVGLATLVEGTGREGDVAVRQNVIVVTAPRRR
jgi:L-aminopeptidase/D-esterase-like protein